MHLGIIEMSVSFSDRLLKDIVIETCTQFEVIAFIPLLRERIYVRNAFTRQFIVSWVCMITINFDSCSSFSGISTYICTGIQYGAIFTRNYGWIIPYFR
jgi:hypothetical protein